MGPWRNSGFVDAVNRKNDLMVTAAFARTLARLAAELDDSEICDEAVLLELLALADRAEEALKAVESP
jgi:flagellar biosynthesis regulator FlbT